MAEYSNPNQQGGQDMKSLMIMVVVFILVFAGMKYFMPQKPVEQRPTPAATQSGAPGQPAVAQQGAAASGAAGAAASAAPQANVIQAQDETETTVENELYRIRFTNRGAQVVSWVLKKYKDSSGLPLDLVQQQAAKQFGYPLSLYTYDAAFTAKLNQALYVPSAKGSLASPATLSFQYSDGATTVHKTFSFDSSYVLHAEVSVTQNGAPVRSFLSWPAGIGDQESTQPSGRGQNNSASDVVDIMQAGKVDHVAVKKVVGGATLQGPFQWAGVSDLYFAAVFLPDSPDTASLVSFHNTIDVPKDPTKKDPNNTQAIPEIGAAMGDLSGITRARVYVGPKGIEILKAVHASGPNAPSLEPLIDFGFFGPIAKGLFYALHFLYEHVTTPNWGWAIVLLTVLINILLLPLRVSTMKSSLKMQRIQPQIAAIKERYKKYKINDPQYAEMNAEVMALQKREGVNMFGGCLPMLIQFPLLFAFYRMLPNVVELRHAHWLWLPDLSSADPYHILPVFMIVTQFLVQFYTPSPGVDPAQQRMMAFTMPAVTGFITWNYASGLALYWAIGNLITIGQQAVMNRTSMGQEMRDIAAKRARRKTGVSAKSGAKTIAARR